MGYFQNLWQLENFPSFKNKAELICVYFYICIRMNVKIFSINSNACCYLTIAIYSEREYRGVFPEKENVVLK